MASLVAELKRQYDVVVPLYEGSFENAKKEAQAMARYLVVYLHCPTHENTKDFVRDVLGSSDVMTHLCETCLLYGASVMDVAGLKLSMELHATTYPCVVVLLKRNLVMRLEGPYTREGFLAQWKECTDTWNGVLAEEISLRFEREARERERASEDNTTLEMENADRERLAQLERFDRERKEEEDRHQAQQEEIKRREEEERLRCEEEEERLRLVEKQNEAARDAAVRRLPQEPPEDASKDEIVRITLKAFSGKQFRRRFWRTDLLELLDVFATSLEEYDGRPFQLLAGFPPKSLQWEAGKTTFAGEPRVCPSATVLMKHI